MIQDYRSKTNSLEHLCRREETNLIDPITSISALRHAKRQMLESSAYALQEGDSLLEMLDTAWKQEDAKGAAAQGFIKQSISLAIGQVSLM